MSKAQKARDIIEKFPHTSKKELGKMLYKLNPILFKDEEAARGYIRAVTGANHSPTIRVKQTDKYKGPLSIPRGELNDFSHYKVIGNKIGILCDIHIPYHDFDAVELAINELQKQKVDTILLNGDLMDCYQISKFEREPTKPHIKQEIEMVCHFLKDLINLKVKIIFKFGNHCERFERFILQKAPELYGFECFELDNLIKTEYFRLINKPLEIDFVKNKRIMDIGQLAVVHGNEFEQGIASPVNASRGFFLKSKANVLGGHLHQTSDHTEPTINGKIIGAWSVGCLCDLHPKYKPINKWNHGFAIVDKFEDGSFAVKNYRITNGRIV